MTPKFSVFKPATTLQPDALAHDIAARAAAAVTQHMCSHAALMGAAELRGYVRARALSVVRAGAQRAVAAGRLPATQCDDLIGSALERTVHAVIRELQSPPVVSIPTPHVPLRSAA